MKLFSKTNSNANFANIMVNCLSETQSGLNHDILYVCSKIDLNLSLG